MDRTALHRRFASRLIPMSRAYRRHLDVRLSDHSLSHTAALAVMLVGRSMHGMRQGMLADELGVEPPSVVPLIDQLERNGLVERRVDTSDKRARLLHLTDAGRNVATQIEERTAKIRDDLFKTVSDEDLAAANRVLDLLDAAFAARDERD